MQIEASDLRNISPLATAAHSCRVPNDRSGLDSSTAIANWIREIKRLWAQGGANTLELARVMSALRNQLRHGEWTSLWRSGQIGFAKRKGEMLVGIGNGLGWANAHDCAHLPPGLRALYYLAKLDRRTLLQLIQEGVIHPALKEAKARELAARFRGMSLAVKSRKLSVRQWLRRCHEFVGANLKYWQARDRYLAAEGLTGLIDEIRAGSSLIPNGNSQTFIPPSGLLTDQQNHHP